METITLPVKFTTTAVNEIKRLIDIGECKPDQYLRVGVKGGGCSGMTYVLGFDEKQADDELYHFDGFDFIMNGSHQLYLYGMQIDWQDGLNSRGFTFQNPNATNTCGCGTSFAV
jgi:iron-sulfur cluster assembly accessory protein